MHARDRSRVDGLHLGVERFIGVILMTESRESWLRRQRVQTEQLKRRASQLAIEIPNHPTWWGEDKDGYNAMLQKSPEARREDFLYLTEIGKIGVRKLIKDEQQKEDEWERARVEWKIKIVVSIITALTGLVGALIGVFAMLRN